MSANERILVELDTLPKGGITYKKINGRVYAYYQWTQDGRQHSRRVKDEELEELSEKIRRRKELQEQVKVAGTTAIKRGNPDTVFQCAVRLGEDLERFAKPVSGWKKRECFARLREYVFGSISDRVYILFGLRRTGKTTLIRQCILDMSEDQRDRTVFIQVQNHNTLKDLNLDLKYLEAHGFEYVFIDEVTLLDDFIEGAALFSDVFAASGMKIVLSGTDSLGFLFTENEELYDRCLMTHTTFIPYREFEEVLGITGIDEYIRYGGTMSIGGKHYNEQGTVFATKKRTDEYIDSAIAHNIQHSLKNYEYEGHIRSLRELYEKNELTNVINRIVEDINHRFTLEVLTREFRSGDLRISAKNLRKNREKPNDILDQVDLQKINLRLKELLEIRNKSEQTVEIQESHRREIKEYLDLLDLTVEIDVRWMTDFNRIEQRTVFSQPGIRYAQANAVIQSLMQDEIFRDQSLNERKWVTERIMDEIRGRMMEDIVLLETKAARKDCEVFKLQFAVGEFDMVVFDPEKGCCEIFEIKHSDQIAKEQYRHLIDENKCRETEFRYGQIMGKNVIYRGEAQTIETDKEEVRYLNVEEYLKGFTKESKSDKI